MNILVIGNGFDLAHGLPTKYTDFLLFCKAIINIIEKSRVEKLIPKNDDDFKNWIERSDKIPLVDIKELNKNLCDESDDTNNEDWQKYKNIYYDFLFKCLYNENSNHKLVKESFYLIYNNFWINYFLHCDMHGKENWIDFESEISKVIKSFDRDMHDRPNEIDLYDEIEIQFSNDFLDTYERFDCCETYKEIRNILENDLNALIRAFEIYLTEYVEKIKIQKKSPDIDGLEIDFILSFNYTHIFSKLYDVSNLSKQEAADPFDYIHGEVDINNTINSNNMVLGIDEYLPKDRKNKEIEFIAFKKFYQRIYKETGCKYKEWSDIIKKNERELKEKYKKEYPNQVPFKQCGDKRHRLYIFGHSLDVTDKDILRDLILNDNVYTTIFYHNKDVMGQQIANLVKVIGQDELIRRTGETVRKPLRGDNRILNVGLSPKQS